MGIVFAILLLHIFQCEGVSAATFTFVNKCPQTIWPAILGSPALETTGFELRRGGFRALQGPTGWSGRFWARTGCSFDGSGHGSCATGDCASGQIECNGAGATAAALAEFTLGSGSMDFYDVSLVDGYNLPVMIDVSGGSGQCASTVCVEDLNRRCPTELRAGGGGACRSACDAFNTAEYCCKGEYGSPATCRPSAYSQVFKSACPKSYSYAYDDATSTFTCTGGDYAITFCPSHPSQKSWRQDDGSCEESVLTDGSWLANLATGESTRRYSFDVSVEGVIVVGAVAHVAAKIGVLQL